MDFRVDVMKVTKGENMDDFATRLKNEIRNGLPGTEIQWQKWFF